MARLIVKDPIYRQLNEALRELIGSGEFAPGAKFLPEREVARRFGVSRATANKALSGLVSEGVLEFRKGVGTFVRGGMLDYDVRSLVSFTRKAIQAGRRPGSRVVRFARRRARKVPGEVSLRLGLAREEEVFEIRRVRLADGEPVILEDRWVVAGHCPGLTEDDAGGSLYEAWAERLGLSIVGAEQVIRAVTLRGEAAGLLETRAGSAALMVESLGLLAGGEPLWWERTLYRGDAYEFHNRLGELRTLRPADLRFTTDPGRPEAGGPGDQRDDC
jgi:GntR family transcriptional regulator